MSQAGHRQRHIPARQPRTAAEQALLQQIRHAAVGWWAACWFAERLPGHLVQEAREWRMEEAAAIRSLAADLRRLRQSASKAGGGAAGATARGGQG